MAITQAMATSFKQELLEGVHNFKNSGGDTFKIALYTSSASLDASTTAYTTSSEVANGNGYTTGGNTLTRVDPSSSGTTGFTDFADTTWSSATAVTPLYNALTPSFFKISFKVENNDDDLLLLWPYCD